ncbi:MAG: glycosyltransferase family 4 protein [Pseudomonadota bacterium]
MKIALIRQKFSRFGGAELYVGRLAARLADQGHEVHILAREWPGAEAGGLVFHPIRAGGPSFLRLHDFARQAAAIVARERFDVVHGFERTWSLDIFRAGDGCHREWLDRRARAEGWSRKALDRVNPRHQAFLNLEARLFSSPRLKIVLANSRLGRDEIMRHYGLGKDMVRVVYNGVDRDRFNPGLAEKYRAEVRAELGLAGDEPIGLFVGSGFARKGLAEIIRSLPRAELKVLVAGADRSGPYEKMAGKLGVKRKVVFLGPRTDVDRLYGAADVFIQPSWYEPFSNACLEALAAGLPVAITRETGAAEAVREGVNGYLLDFPVNPEELAEKATRAARLDRTRVSRANQDILAPFSWEANLARTLAAYEEIMGGRSIFSTGDPGEGKGDEWANKSI